MKSLLKELLYDKDVVVEIEKAKLNKNVLYNYLCNGKITLQEYLSAEQKLK